LFAEDNSVEVKPSLAAHPGFGKPHFVVAFAPSNTDRAGLTTASSRVTTWEDEMGRLLRLLSSGVVNADLHN
jgi:hypothetical protein